MRADASSSSPFPGPQPLQDHGYGDSVSCGVPVYVPAVKPVPNYTAWWQRHMCVNNLPKIVTRQYPGAESNLRLWVTSGLQVRHVTVWLPSHTTTRPGWPSWNPPDAEPEASAAPVAPALYGHSVERLKPTAQLHSVQTAACSSDRPWCRREVTYSSPGDMKWNKNVCVRNSRPISPSR